MKEKIKGIICDILNRNNIALNEDIFNKLDIYCNYLIEQNEVMNLTAVTDPDEIYIKHFADSMLFSKTYKYGAEVCDIGSGAGFPGVVLKIIRPDLKILLVDSLNKRVNFLNNLIVKLGLTDICAIHNRVEDVDFKNKYLNYFDYVTARAVASMPTLTEYCLPFVKVGGQFLAYKSNNINEELLSSKKAVNQIGGKINSAITDNISYDIIRKLIIIDKISVTNTKYPRGQNKPRLAPIE